MRQQVRVTSATLLILAAAVILAAPAGAADYQVGDRIVVLRESEISVSSKKVADAWPGMVLTVQHVNEQWLWVKHTKPGWVDSAHVGRLDREAVKRLTDAIQLQPNSARLRSGRAQVWMELGELDQAIEDHDRAIELAPQDAGAHNNRGFTWFNKGDLEKAVTDYAQAVRLDPRYARAYNNRGLAHAMRGDYELALKDYEEAMRLDPKDSAPHNDLAWLLATCPQAEIRDGKRAVQHATKSCELTGWKDPNGFDTLAAAYAEAGIFAKAIEAQTKGMQIANADEKADFASRLTLYKAGKPFREPVASK